MCEVQVAHTAELDAATRQLALDLLYDVFEGDMTAHDWEHALGGMHALAWDDGRLVGHASVIQRRLMHGGRAWRTGYVEAVGVVSGFRRRGVGGAMMAPLERVIRDAYDLGALGASDMARKFYAARGWEPWRGATSALTPDGIRRTEAEDDCIYVLPVSAPLDLAGTLTCDWRDGDVW